jgi:Tfp pilus assembly protein PilX
VRDREYHIGPGAVSLLLVIVIVSMSVLGLLGLISARGDYKFTERAVSLVEAENAAAAQAERSLAGLDALLMACAEESQDDASYLSAAQKALPENMILSERSVSWQEKAENGRTLFCEAEIAPLGEMPRAAWTEHMFIAEANIIE